MQDTPGKKLQAIVEARAASKKDFAASLGIVPAYLSQIFSGFRKPSFPLMVKIERATNGEMPVTAWVPDQQGATE